MAAEADLKDYHVVIVQDLDVPSGSPAPESAGLQMAEKAVYQIKRYNENINFLTSLLKRGRRQAKGSLRIKRCSS